MPTSSWLEDLHADRPALSRASTVGRVADLLRTRITEGQLAPGTRLSEEGIVGALGVSRSTLREAFRQLGHERLLVHEFNRGVFVRELTVDDVRDLYEMRRIVECGAVRRAGVRAGGRVPPPAPLLDPVGAAVAEGEAAAGAERWGDVGTANMHFHQALADLAQSPRISEATRQLLAELRLVFHVMAAPREFHAGYLGENRRIFALLEAGDLAGAEDALAAYLDRAEAQLVEAYE